MSGLLNGQEIKEANLIEGALDEGFRAASYDIHIGKIVGPGGALLDSYKLPPQGIVEVVSKERMKLPDGISGYALVKTSLCSEGLLALNIGIIDPGYDGLLSSSLVNFSQRDRLLTVGETFLRLTFHRVKEAGKPRPLEPIGDDELIAEQKRKDKKDYDYIAEKRRKVAANFSEHFLNVHDLVDEATDDAMEKLRKTFFWGVPLMGFALAAVTFFMNYGAIWAVQRTFNPTNSVEAAQVELALQNQNKLLRTSLRDNLAQNQKLEERVEKLEQLLKSLNAPTPSPAPKPTSP